MFSVADILDLDHNNLFGEFLCPYTERLKKVALNETMEANQIFMDEYKCD